MQVYQSSNRVDFEMYACMCRRISEMCDRIQAEKESLGSSLSSAYPWGSQSFSDKKVSDIRTSESHANFIHSFNTHTLTCCDRTHSWGQSSTFRALIDALAAV